MKYPMNHQALQLYLLLANTKPNVLNKSYKNLPKETLISWVYYSLRSQGKTDFAASAFAEPLYEAFSFHWLIKVKGKNDAMLPG
jgi:hypothetical protein